MSEQTLRVADRLSAPLGAVVGPVLRQGLVVAALLLIFVTFRAFQSLGTSSNIELSSGNETQTYAALLALATLAAVLVRAQWSAAGRALATRANLAMAGWLVVTSLVSDDPGTSIRRLVLFGMCVTLAGSLMLLAESQERFARLLAIAMGVVVALSFGGVLLVPDLAIHQITDVGEPDLAGDWRGVFGHKNDAAAVFSLFVFLGLFVARSGLRLAGLGLVALSVLFMVFAGGKSALALVVLTLAMSGLWHWRGAGRLRIAAVLAPVVVLNVLGVGSVLSPGLAAFTQALPVDATFTGRTDIWSFAIDNLQGHLLTGHGFDAFWNTADTRFGGEDQGWAGTAAHAHNSYLDMVVGMGLPGLALALAVFLVQPLRDVLAAERRRADPALRAMLLQVWLFGLYLSGMETIFFQRSGPVWFTFLVAVCGLRYAACYRLRRSEPA